MTKRMLINATQAEQIRVALVDGQWLYDLDIETQGKEQKKGNIYKGVITRIEPSLEAAFVNYGAERHGFLPFREIADEYLDQNAVDDSDRIVMKDAIREGLEVIIQIDKEERGSKGAALTTYISLAGSFLVLMPNNPKAGGISRRIEGDERDELRESLQALNVPDSMGVIIRTAGVGRSTEELQWDSDVLLSQWQAIRHAADEGKAPFMIYKESSVVIRAVRDNLRQDIGEILIDNMAMYEEVRNHMQIMRPDSVSKLKFYSDNTPLFTRFQIESQIESAFRREVQLPSGGAIAIDNTEALISIDINSAKATKGGDIEETALQTNLEAADEIARQLRLRDIGGLIVIDFIDMLNQRNQRSVENQLRNALAMDRARVQVGRISRFGLLEMSRQRLRPSLGDAVEITCPRCQGQGRIRSIEALALIVLRMIEEETLKENTVGVHAELPVEVATYLINEKRTAIIEIEQRQNVKILLIPNETLTTPNYRIERVRASDDASKNDMASYQRADRSEAEKKLPSFSQQSAPKELPAVQPTQTVPSVIPSYPAQRPVQKNKPSAGFIKRLWSSIMGNEEEEKAPPKRRASSSKRRYQKKRTSSGHAKSGHKQRRPQQSTGGSGENKHKPSNPSSSSGSSSSGGSQQGGRGRGGRSSGNAQPHHSKNTGGHHKPRKSGGGSSRRHSNQKRNNTVAADQN